MKNDPFAEKLTNRHHRTRANRQQAGMVSVLLHLPPALVKRIDEERGERPRTQVALDSLLTQSGLDAEILQSTLRRGRPSKVAVDAVPQVQVPPVVESMTVESVPLQVADWQALLKQVPDPRSRGNALPDERKCWRQDGSDWLTRLSWVIQFDDPRLEYVEKLGGAYGDTDYLLLGRDGWVMTPQQAAQCIKRFNLVNLQAWEVKPQFEGWCIDVVDCGSWPGATAAALRVGRNCKTDKATRSRGRNSTKTAVGPDPCFRSYEGARLGDGGQGRLSPVPLPTRSGEFRA